MKNIIISLWILWIITVTSSVSYYYIVTLPTIEENKLNYQKEQDIINNRKVTNEEKPIIVPKNEVSQVVEPKTVSKPTINKEVKTIAPVIEEVKTTAKETAIINAKARQTQCVDRLDNPDQKTKMMLAIINEGCYGRTQESISRCLDQKQALYQKCYDAYKKELELINLEY